MKNITQNHGTCYNSQQKDVYKRQPCTIGFFRQKIVFPESFPLHPDFIMVYKHEHTHLKNHDNLVKLLCLFVLCLHWMNPVSYTHLENVINSVISEQSTDVDTISGATFSSTGILEAVNDALSKAENA